MRAYIMSSLVIPEWCNADIVMKDDDDDGGGGWSLEEIKNGIVVQKYPIQKSCIFFGREADVVDVCTAHGSCSRVHARIAFDSKYAWLRDLGSAHGTKVNKESLPSISIGKDIPNNNNNNNNNGTIMKGVIVYPGDIIQFGASTRFYCLHGPSQYSRESIQSQKLQLQQKQQKQQKQQQRKEEGISWGMDMNDDDKENDEDETNNNNNGHLDWYKIFEKNQLPSNCKSLYQQWTNKQNKLKHIQEESQRIERKHELTEGQTVQLERNLQKQSSIQIEIEQIENELEDKFYNTNNPTKKRKQQTYHDDDDDDVDDFYDRTKHAKSQHSNNNNTIVETQESLLKQWKQHLNDQTEMNVEYQRRQQIILNIQQQIANSTSDDDVFFIKNDLQIANDNLTQIKMKLSSIEQELQSVEKLLNVILPNDHTLDRIHQQIITPEMTTKTKSTNNDTMLPPAPRPSIKPSASSNNDVNDQSNSLKPPPPSPSCNNEKKQVTNSLMLPPPSKSRNDEDKPVTNSLMLPPPSRSSSTTKVRKPSSSDQMAPPPPRKPVTRPRKLIGPSNHVPPMYQNQEKQNKSSFDNTKDEWTAPKDQDGSGITKLNAKFAGRY